MNFETFLRQFDKWQSQPHMFIVDKKRVKAMETAANMLEEIIQEYTPDASVEINMSVVNDGSASISVETDELVVHNVQDFISIVKEANNFEIYPINDGNIRIAIMFNGIMNLVK